MGTLIIWLVILLVLSAFFSASETALTSLSRVKIKTLIEKGGKRFESLNQWVENPAHFLTTILIGNNIVNIAASFLAAWLAIKLWGEHSVAIVAGVMTFLVLVFGEIIPKTIARDHHEKAALFLFPPLLGISYVLRPLVRVFVCLAAVIIRLFGGRLSPQARRMSTEEIQTLIEIGEEDGALAEDEREIIKSVIEFRETVVSNVMTPRVDVVAVSEDATISDCLAVMVREGHSRLPVYGEGMDDVLGVVDYRQILNYLADGDKSMLVRQVMRPTYFVPEGMKVSALLKEFQRRKFQLAIVMDEYGGTSGLVTLEDLLEEIVGEIADVHEARDADYQRLDERTFRVNAKMEIEKVGELLGLDLEEDEESETVGGFILNRLGHIPVVGEQFRYHNFLFTVDQADERSVSQLLVQKLVPRQAS